MIGACIKEAPAKCRRFPIQSSADQLIATVDVDVADVTAIVDVAFERQVGLLRITIAEGAVGTDAIWAVARHPAAAGKTAHSNRATARHDLSDAQDAARGGVSAQHR